MPKVQTNKEELIKKSMQVFIKTGYFHTTLACLAKACSIEKPHFYYYFKDKKDLMNQVLIYASAQIEKLVFDIAYKEDIKPSVRLHVILDNVLKIHTKNKYGCLMGNTLLETVGREPYFKPVLCAYFNKWRETLTHLYLAAYEEEQAKDMANEDVAKLQGGIMLMRLYEDKDILGKVTDNIKTRL